MCNAWNHPIGCTCGWGGDGHLGGGQGGSEWNNINLVHWNIFENKNLFVSYTNPNAKCPVCGASVFYYKSPNGGRVFFDELGPPWPKHPCTDTDSKPNYPISYIPYSGFSLNESTKWSIEKWNPGIVFSIGSKSQYCVIFELINASEKSYLETMIYDVSFIDLLKSNENILFIKYLDDKEFQLNVYDSLEGVSSSGIFKIIK